MGNIQMIAVDPDVTKNGVAMWDGEKLSVYSFTFPGLVDFISKNKDIKVIVEGGWLNKKSNYHGYSGGYGQKIASRVGRNEEVGRKIVEMCDFYGIEVEIRAPLRKTWKGRNKKITQKEIVKFIPGFPSRSNSEERDAALLLWVELGKPIRI